MALDPNWFRALTPEKLEQAANGCQPGSPERRMAEAEIRRRAKIEADKASSSAAEATAKRHQQSLDASRKSQLIQKVAIGVTVVVAVCGISIPFLVRSCKSETRSQFATPRPAPENAQPAQLPVIAAVSTNGQIEAVTATRPPVSEWCKVKIGAAGDIYVNKRQMSSVEFSIECARLKKVGGAIVLFVDSPNHVASPAQAEVMRKIVEAGVAMKATLKESELE